jgi:hypothetical protein
VPEAEKSGQPVTVRRIILWRQRIQGILEIPLTFFLEIRTPFGQEIHARRAKKLMRLRRKTAIGHPIVLCISPDVRRRVVLSIYPGKEGRCLSPGDFSRHENGR